ncbi:METTL21B, partial [Symbiodinium necroappetens]
KNRGKKAKRSTSSSGSSPSSSTSSSKEIQQKKKVKKEERDDYVPAQSSRGGSHGGGWSWPHRSQGNRSWGSSWKPRQSYQQKPAWNRWSKDQDQTSKGPDPAVTWDKAEPDDETWEEEQRLQQALAKSAIDEAWTETRRVLSYREIPVAKRPPSFKEASAQIEAPQLEAMEARIRDAAKLPAPLLAQVAKLFCSIPQERLPPEMRWRQIQGAHFDASILDLNLELQYDWDLELPDPVHHQSLTFAHGTTWAGAYGVISESLLRPQAAKSDCYPSFGAFGRGSIEAYTEHTSAKALESAARKSKGQTVVLLCSAVGLTKYNQLYDEITPQNRLYAASKKKPSETPAEKPRKTLGPLQDAWSLIPKTAEDLSSPAVLSGSEYRDALQGCLMRATKRVKIQMPWETPIMQSIFGEPEMVPAVPFSSGEPSKPEESQGPGEAIEKLIIPRVPVVATSLAAIKNRPNVSFPKSEEALRLKGIALWCEIVWTDPHHFGITRHISLDESSNSEEKAEELSTCVEAVMGVKAPSTIHSRAMVIKRFLFWCAANNKSAWPMSESTVFEYVSHLKTIGAATAPSSFLQSTNFMIYTVEPEGAQAIVESYLILGVAKQAASKKRALKQAPALRVDMVLQLHAILRHQSLDTFDRLAAGLILMCVYGRCRCSDLRYVQELSLDVTGRHGFIVRTEFHKTANKEKRKLLPIVAPAFGVTDENWAQQFLLLREKSLGKFQPGPFLPAPLLEGKFSERHIDSDEFTSLLRHLLREFVGA